MMRRNWHVKYYFPLADGQLHCPCNTGLRKKSFVRKHRSWSLRRIRLYPPLPPPPPPPDRQLESQASACLFCLLHREKKEKELGKEIVHCTIILARCCPLYCRLSRPQTREYIDCSWPLSSVHSVMMVFSAQLAEGEGARPPPFTLSIHSTLVTVHRPIACVESRVHRRCNLLYRAVNFYSTKLIFILNGF